MTTILERPLNEQECLMLGFLQRAVNEFNSNVAAPGIMRRLANERPGIFFIAAVRLLRDAAETPARRHLAGLLLNQPEAIARLMDLRQFTRLDTALLFKRLMEVDQMLDVRVARELPGRHGEQHS